MRELKFRAWNNGMMSQPFGLGEGVCWPSGSVSTANRVGEVMQYINFVDINGVEIYEGDIVACIKDHYGEGKHQYWAVEYGYAGESGFFAVDQVNSGRLLDAPGLGCEASFTTNGRDTVMCEVIGNIHENADLLND